MKINTGKIMTMELAEADVIWSRQADKAVLAKASTLHLLFDGSRYAMMTLAPPSWKFTIANPAALQLFGVSSVAEFISLGPWGVSPEWQPDGRASSEKAAEMIATAMSEGSNFFEWEHKRLGGGPFHADVQLTRIEAEDEVFLQATVRDITKRKQIEAKLRIAATVFESQEGMLVTDANTVILSVNSAFTKATGYTAEEVIGQTPRLLKSGNHDADFYAAMWQSINNTGAWEGEIWNRRKNGEIYPEYLTITAVKDNNGSVVNYVATLRDITTSRAAAEEIKNLAF
jgi:PAS domain S-box-containing protein